VDAGRHAALREDRAAEEPLVEGAEELAAAEGEVERCNERVGSRREEDGVDNVHCDLSDA